MSFDIVCVCVFLLILSLIGIPQTARAAELSDQELVSRQARIGRITVQVDDVFEASESLSGVYRLVNALHINSRQSTIAAQLLFHSGDIFDRRILDESERLLRDQRYLNEATIEVGGYNETDNTVDLLVRAHDVWTLSPGISFGRKGGSNNTRIELEENNLLGFGKRIEFRRSQDVDRTSLRVRYQDPNVLDSRWRLATAYATSSDGGEKTINLAHPFYSLDTHWSAGLLASDVTTGVSRFRQGEVVEQFRMRKRLLDASGGISDGLENGWVRRYLAGMHYESREFSSLQWQQATLPTDRIIGYPWVGIELLEDNYVKTHNFNQIRRTEDIHLGLATRLEAGYAAPAFGATHAGVIVNASFSLGSAIDDRQYLFNDAVLSGRIEDGELRNGNFAIGSRYYRRHNSYSGLFASAAVTLTSKLDSENQLTMGGDNGLRGYPLRYQSGKRLALVTLEERFYTHWQPLKLVDVGAAIFFDAGRAWESDSFGGEPLGWLKDVGFGLRLGNARSALGNVLHIDLAFPLNGPRDISSMQFIVETRRSF